MRLSALIPALFGVVCPSPVAAQTPPTLDALRQKAIADSNDPGVHHALAMALWDVKDWDAAEASLRTAVRIAPSYADAYLALSALGPVRGAKYWKDVAKKRGDSSVAAAMEESGRFYRRAFLLNPMVNLKPLGKYEAEIWAPWAGRLRSGVNAMYQGSYHDAYRKLDALRRDLIKEIKPDDSTDVGPLLPTAVLWNHALAAARVDSFRAAAADMIDLFTQEQLKAERAPERTNPIWANDYRYFTAMMLYLAGLNEPAIQAFETALANDISLYVAHVQLARIYEETEQWDKAIQERERALATNPEDSGLMVELAALYLRRDRAADAVPLLETAATANPRDVRIHLLRGQAAAGAGDHATARRWLEKFVRLAPSSFGSQVAAVKAQLQRLP